MSQKSQQFIFENRQHSKLTTNMLLKYCNTAKKLTTSLKIDKFHHATDVSFPPSINERLLKYT